MWQSTPHECLFIMNNLTNPVGSVGVGNCVENNIKKREISIL